MGIALTQVITEDRASGSQVIDGSLKFDNEAKDQHLTKTYGSDGNRQKWTLSVWVKLGRISNEGHVFESYAGSGDIETIFRFNNDNKLRFGQFTTSSPYDWQLDTNAVFRDTNAWYHVVLVYDSNNGTEADRAIIYVNGERQTLSTASMPTSGENSYVFKSGYPHYFCNSGLTTRDFGGQLSQAYLIEGQALDPSYFGFTDELTNTWRPKKYEGTFGTNGFWLPMDGNTLIGKDQSGNNNDWTPVNFGGSNSIEKATGAFPILNTINGGRVATAGVRTDSAAATCVLALPLNDGTAKLDVSNQINGGSSEKTITINGNAAATNTQSNFYGGSFTFDGTEDYLTIPANTDFDFGTGAYTIEMWLRTTQDAGWLFYNASNDTGMRMCVGANGTNSSNAGKIEFNEQVSNGDDAQRGTSRVDDGKWHHIAVCRGSSGGTRLYVNGNLEVTGSAGRNFDNDNLVYIGARESNTGSEFNGQLQDLRVYKGVAKYTSNFIPASTDPDILPDTPSGVSVSSKLTKITDGAVAFDGTGDYLQIPNHADLRFGSGDFCVEAFVYYSETSGNGTIAGLWNSGSNRRSWLFQIESDNRRLRGFYSTDGSSSTAINATTGQMTRNAWHHVAYTRNGTTLRIFLDGVEVGSQTSESGTLYDNSDDDIGVGSAQGGASADPITGFISNVRIVKGSAVYTANFTPPSAPLTDITNTKLLCAQSTTSATFTSVIPTGSITANGDAAATNFNPFNTDINTVRGRGSGWCTLNPLKTGSAYTLSDGNLAFSAGTNWDGSCGTISVSSGKWYYEVTRGSGTSLIFGWCIPENYDETTEPGDPANSSVWRYRDDGTKRNGEGSGQSYGETWTAEGSVAGCALDLDAGTIRFYVNGKDQGIAYSNLAGNTITPVVAFYNGNSTVNFGQKSFKYTPPDGFQPLCVANLPRPASQAAVRPDKYVGIVTYIGDGNTNREVTGLNMQPDLALDKSLGANGNHCLVDSVRGVNERIITNSTGAETTNTGTVNSFNYNGFTIGDSSLVNTGITTYVAWCWKAGGAAVSNDDGSLTTQVSASPESGFSIIGYTGNQTTGASIGHGLNQAPEMLIFKSLAEDRQWLIWHKDLNAGAGDYYLQFNALKRQQDTRTDRPLKDSGCVTDTTIILGQDQEVNNSNDMLCYAFHSVSGFSKIGKYDGNGDANGIYISCGFRPAVLLLKNYAGGSETDWIIQDNTRSTYNPVDSIIRANTNQLEATGNSNYYVDFLSNGFKLRTSSAAWNEDGSSDIFMAFAEAPTNNLYGGQANAR